LERHCFRDLGSSITTAVDEGLEVGRAGLFIYGLFTRTVILTMSDAAVASDIVKITVRVNRPLLRPQAQALRATKIGQSLTGLKI
jgi:hypothetical protein